MIYTKIPRKEYIELIQRKNALEAENTTLRSEIAALAAAKAAETEKTATTIKTNTAKARTKAKGD